MPFQAGVFKRLFSWRDEATAGRPISAVEFDQDGADVATALSNAILRDGTGLPTADTPWNGKKLTGLAAPVNAGDAIGLGMTPATEVTRALGFAPVQQGTGTGQAAGPVMKFGYNAALGPTLTIDLSNYGRVWTDVGITTADLVAKLGYWPPIDYYRRDNPGHFLGFNWDTSAKVLNAYVDSVFAGGVWTNVNLTTAALAGIVGYVPARPSGTFKAGAGNVPDLPVGQDARVNYATCDFVATATSMSGVATASAQNNTAGSGVVNAYCGSDLLDVATGSVVAIGTEAPAGLVYGNGLSHLASFIAAAGLTVGRTYRLRLYLYKNSSAGACQAVNLGVQGGVF